MLDPQQQQPRQVQGQTLDAAEDLFHGPLRSRQQTITEGTAAFLGCPPEKVFDVLRGIWTTTKGQPPLSKEEMLVGMGLVSRYDLDPFAREIYVTRGKKGLMTIIGLDGWIKVLDRTDHYDGFDVSMEFGPEPEKKLESVTTTIYSTKRSHPATYTAFANEYSKLSGFMADKIPSHMLRIFSLKHAARLFVPLGTVVTEEEAAWMNKAGTAAATQSHIEQAKAERAAVTVHDVPGSQSTSAAACNAIEALAAYKDQLREPPDPPTPPTLGRHERPGGGTETTAERIDRENAGDPDPPLDPPTPEEVARADDNRDHEQAVANRDAVTDDQIATGRDIIARIGKCVSPANFDKVQDDAVALFNDGRLAQVDCVKISALIEIGRAGLGT